MSQDINPIRAARQKARKSIVEVAGGLGVSERTVRRWELGQTIPPADSLIRLARLLHRRPEELMRVA